MELGLSTYTFPWAFGIAQMGYRASMNLTDLLHYAQQQGVRRVQVGDNFPLHLQSKADCQQWAALARDLGIQIEVGTRRLERAHIQVYLELAEIFESPFIRVVVDDDDYRPGPRQVITILDQLVPELKARERVLAIENHDRFTASTLKRIIEFSDADWVNVCLDTANSLGANDGIATVLEHLAPYTINLHIKDFRIQRWPHLMGFRVEGCAAGQGILDIPALLQQIAPYEYCQSVTLELWSSPLDTQEETLNNERQWAASSINYLKKMVAFTYKN